MTGLDAAVLAERTAAVRRHLRRVADRLPDDQTALRPLSDDTDAVVLHLWQAVQVVVDLAMSACVTAGLGAPSSYGRAFHLLADHRILDRDLAARLARAAGFRNLVAHAYADLDLVRVHAIATHGPPDLLAFLTAMRDHVDST